MESLRTLWKQLYALLIVIYDHHTLYAFVLEWLKYGHGKQQKMLLKRCINMMLKVAKL